MTKTSDTTTNNKSNNSKGNSNSNSSKDPSKFVHKVDPTQPDYVPWRERKRPPGSQAGRYKRFDKSIPNGAERVLVPNQDDVVFGRGKGSHDQPGNKRMREIIRRHKKDYAAIHRSKKRQIAELVYSEITQHGARFLHKVNDEEGYAVVDLNLALQKLSNTLRCRKSCLIENEDDGEAATTTPLASPIMSAAAAAAATVSGRAIHTLGRPLPPVSLLPQVGLTSTAGLPGIAAATDPLLRQRYLGGLGTTRADLLLPPDALAEQRLLMAAPPSLAERELLLLRRSTALHAPLAGGSPFLGPSMFSSAHHPLSSLQQERYNEMVLAEQEYLLARKRLRSAALGL
ncbi:MAG: hypothetical protein SGBAC_003542 [Bacillariaceae sp.]